MANVMRWLRVVPAKGDVNEDGAVNILDVVWAVNIILELITPSSSQVWASDCNDDGMVNIIDAIGIVNDILGIGPCAPGFSGSAVTPEVVAFFEGLQPHFSAADFENIMAMLHSARTIPADFALSQNYPNPFNPTTTISYSLPVQSTKSKVERAGTVNFQLSTLYVTLRVFNVLGQQVRTLVDDMQQPGSYHVVWDGKDTSGREAGSGVYFCQLKAGSFLETRRMVLMK